MANTEKTMKEIDQIQRDKKSAFNLGLFASIVIFIGVVLFMIANNRQALLSQTYTYSMLIVVPLFITLAYIINSQLSTQTGKNTWDFSMLGGKQISILFGISAFIIALSYIFYKASSASLDTINMALNFFIFVAIIIAMGIIYKLFSDRLARLKNAKGWTGFIITLIFYIPCLFSDFLQYLFNEYKITHNIVLVLFVLEILVILLCLYLPRLLNTILTSNSVVLLNAPVFLDSGIINLGTSSSIYKPSSSADRATGNNNYTLSMWIYINPKSSSNSAYSNETEIFKYGYTDPATNILHSKPRITYSNDASSNNVDTFHIYFSENSSQPKPVNVTVVGQRWNQFLFNYTSSHVDLFVNGNLERTVYFSNNIPAFALNDVFTVGSTPGLDGSICCIQYTSPPLSKYQITNSYNMLVNQNPPRL